MRTGIICCAALLCVLCLSFTAEAAVQTATITYDANGTPCEGFAAWDDSIEGPRPGVLVVHQWMGLSDYERRRCELLAELGYVAFACDIYGAGQRPTGFDDAPDYAGKYRSDLPLFRERLQAGLAALKAQPDVDASRVAAIGYCFGGGGVLELARDGGELLGVVSFHGSYNTALPAEPGAVKAKILVCHGAADPVIPLEHITGLWEELTAAGADWQFISYSDAVHSFTDWHADRAGFSEYQEAADLRSWQHMQDFLNELFS